MPRIEQYTRQIQPRGFQGVRASADQMGGGVGRAMQGLGQTVDQVRQNIEKIQFKRDKAEYINKTTAFELENMKAMQELSQQEFEDEKSIAAAYQQNLEQRAEQLQIPDSMQDQWTADFGRMQVQFAQGGFQEQARRVGARAVADYENTNQTLQNMVALDPTKLDYAMKMAEEASSSIPDSVKRLEATELAKDRIRQSAANSLAENSPDAFLQRYKDGEFKNTPDAQMYAKRAKKRQEEIKRERQAQLQSEISGRIDDAMAEASMTGKSEVMPDESIIRAAYDKDKADEIIESYKEAQEFGVKYQSVATATPQEIEELIQSSAPEGVDFQREQKEQSALIKALESRNAKIKKNASAYVQESFSDVRSAYDKYEQDQSPSTLQYAVSLNLEKQEMLGVPYQMQTAIGQDHAKNLAMELQGADPQDRIETMQAYSQMYGKYWPIVKQELKAAGLDSATSVALEMESPSQSRARSLLMEAENVEGFDKIFDNDTKTDITDQVASELQDYFGSVLSQPQNAKSVTRIQSAAETLAKMYVVQDKISPSDAAVKASKDIANDYYNVVGRARVPVQYNSDLVQSGMEQALTLVTDNQNIDPQIMGSLTNVPQDIIKQQYLEELKLGGYFVTNPEEDGVFLYDKQGFSVILNNGEPFEIKYKDLENLGQTDKREYKSIREGF